MIQAEAYFSLMYRRYLKQMVGWKRAMEVQLNQRCLIEKLQKVAHDDNDWDSAGDNDPDGGGDNDPDGDGDGRHYYTKYVHNLQFGLAQRVIPSFLYISQLS